MGKRLGTYVQELRQQKGASIRRLGDQLGLSPSHLSLIERGQREVSISTLYPIVQALDGDFARALCLLALDAGVPEEELPQDSS
jgi:transcriptional regulator with XRE-family HTH domain